jgi:RNA-dependent RNA polymerase
MFFREENDWNVKKLMNYLGETQNVYVNSGYAKFSARLALSFSSTVSGMDVSPVPLRSIHL